MTDPAHLDLPLLRELAEKYGGAEMVAALADGQGINMENGPDTTGHLEDLDDYSRCEIRQVDDIRRLFVDRFYFGCEADDPANAWAFSEAHNPMSAKLKALYGSDIGHFDVPDMLGVLPEAYELVEDELITHDDFADFVFGNAVRLWGETNPDFFAGTSVESDAAALLG